MTSLIEDLHHEDLYYRLKAGVELVSEHATELLIGALGHIDMEVRWRAAAALGLIRDSRASQALISVLKDKTYDVRYSAAWALGMIGDETAFEALAETALNEGDIEIAIIAAFALTEINRERAVKLLQPKLADADRLVYKTANTALNKLNYL
jgi:HEAT repeat protein